ncbi:cell division cycle-associated 7-like protein [Carex littledalei]|uniref:Cell division cycle-associated 7-like protein n=1 Tax=Carex littledalei TaxID=544730 RepID=A0A833QTT6_9POAL|nr:cell division cycle-associated 7-like protein [Carex littledalei]
MKSEAMDYEKCREERIKSNMDRMQQLGILNLSRHVNTAFKTPNSRRVLVPTDGTKKKVDLITPPLPSRRSSRLQNVAPVNYIEAHGKKSNDLTESDVALIE